MWQDLRYAFRTLAKSPGFTIVAILALILGIGANTAMFTIVNGVLLRPMPYRDASKLVRVYETYLPSGVGSVSTPDFRDWREQSQAFDGIAAYHTVSRNLQNTADPERIPAVEATANLFEVLGSRPLHGRTFLPDEDQPGKAPVAVISERLWKRRFASDPKLVGKTIVLDAQQYTVAGIMPREFEFPLDARANVWIPAHLDKPVDQNRGSHFLDSLGRLKSGIELAVAQQQMDGIGRSLAAQYPNSNGGRSVKLTPLEESIVGKARPTLLLLMGAVGFVLLIACANVANLLLARAAARKKELAVRVALGAGRVRLVRLFLTESILLAFAGGAGGLLVALWGSDALVALSGDQLPRLTSVPFDYRVFGFLALVCLLTGILFGAAPALAASRTNLLDGLQESGRTSSGRGQRMFRSVVVVGEIALALMLTIGASLLMKTFLSVAGINSGFVAENVLTLQVSLPRERYPMGTGASRFYLPIRDRVLSIPGVRAAGWTLALPLQKWGINGDFGIEGRPSDKAGKAPQAEFRLISPGYFNALGIPILHGRDFSELDGQQSHRAAIVNEALARRYYPGEDPIGKRVQTWTPDWAVIVAVVGDVKQSKLNNKTLPEIYVPIPQVDVSGYALPMSLAVRSVQVRPETLTSAIRAAVREVDPDQPIYNVKTMQRVVADSVSDRRLYVVLFGVFAAIAVTLAAAGIYGVMSYLVTQRTQEIGIRLALGAQQSAIARLVVAQGLWMALLGVALGMAGSLAVNRLLTSLLYGVKATDPLILIGVCCFLVMVALAASYMPARRAMQLDPIETLKYF
jgi:putative ABC transport system permease protein